MSNNHPQNLHMNLCIRPGVLETLAEELFHWQAFSVALTVAERYQDACPIGMHMIRRLAANRFPDNYSFEWTMDDFDNVEQKSTSR